MRNKDKRTREAIFAKRVDGNIDWKSVESLLRVLGADMREKSVSGVGVTLNGVSAVFDRPHPRRECGRSLVKRVRSFLESAGEKP